MTPKEKIIELFNKFNKTIPIDTNNVPNLSAIKKSYEKHNKECALIAVNEILKTNPYEWDGEDLNSTIDYWEDVKKEIEKL